MRPLAMYDIGDTGLIRSLEAQIEQRLVVAGVRLEYGDELCLSLLVGVMR